MRLHFEQEQSLEASWRQTWRQLVCTMVLLAQAVGAAAGQARNSRSTGQADAAVRPSIEELVQMYRTRSDRQAVTLVTRWSDERVTSEVRRLLAEDVSRRAEQPPEVRVLPSLDVVGLDRRTSQEKAAEAAERAARRLAAAALVAERAVSLLGSGDGRPLAPGLATASLLLGADLSAADSRSFARDFSLLAGILLHWHVELAAGHQLLAKAVRDFPDDPELHTALGSIVETVASLRTYEPRGDSEAATNSGGYTSEGGEQAGVLPDATLGDAEVHYEHALALDPGLHEARLRLGHVRLLEGRLADALVELERVAKGAGQPRQRYLACLFAGAAREKLGDVAGAITAYRACIEGGPRAQTALLALGRALDRLGDKSGAQEAFAGAAAAGRLFDPWWSYRFGQPERAENLVAQLRGLVH
jgi:Flp pilus assembly protein TadD